MGNVFSISNPLSCTLNMDQEVRYVLCPALESGNLCSGRDTLKRSREAVKNRIRDLDGLPGEVVKEEVRTWIAAVDRFDWEVTELLDSLKRHTSCFRFLCCCCYPWNYALGQQVRDKLQACTRLSNEHDRWNDVLTRRVERSPVEAMGDELRRLQALEKDLENMVDQQILLSGGRMQKSHEVTDWFAKVERLLAEAKEEYQQLTSNGESHRMDGPRAVKISKIRAQLEILQKDGEKFKSIDKGDLLIMAVPDKFPDLAVPKFLVGVEGQISEIFGYLKDDEVSFIGIYGMGGAGKTTLVGELVKRLRSPEPEVDFDVVIFAVVSKTPNIFNIQEAIGEKLGFSGSHDARGSSLPNEERERAKTLKEILSRKKFLLILDDVWAKLDCEKIGIPFLGSGTKSKVLLTTRIPNVCSDMRCDKDLHVGCLGEDDSWNLFCHMLGKGKEYMESKQEIREIAKRIERKCGGLPLVIITVACALAKKSSDREWKDAGRLFRSIPSGHIKDMKNVFKLLKVSFDYLERDEYRSCLLFCAMYPEDFQIEVDEVIKYWIGEGLLEFSRHSNILDLEAFGRSDIIATLRGACLLEEGEDEDHVKMHDSIRDMAIWLGKGGEDGNYKHKFLSVESGNVENVIVDGKWEDVERARFIPGEISSFAFPNLQSLLFNRINLKNIPEELFRFTPNLRVLDLSYNYDLENLPESLWSLKLLRYLNLSKTRLVRIPEGIGSLTSLQFLYVCETPIVQVAVEVRQLTNLVVLDLSSAMPVTIPYHAISSLLKLQILHMKYTIRISSGDGGRIKDLNNLRQLNQLSLCLNTQEDIKEIQECDVLKRAINCLQFCKVENLTMADVNSVLSGLPNLRELLIQDCQKLEVMLPLPSHGGLQELKIGELPLLSSIVVESQWQLPNLRKLVVFACQQLRDLGCLLQLPSLEILSVSVCREMVELIPSSSSEAATVAASSSSDRIFSSALSFPKLKEITLAHLESLESISKVRLHLPSLQLMSVVDCPKLRKLPVIQSDQKTVTGKHWWKAVMWDYDHQWLDELQWDEDGDDEIA